VKQLPTIYIVRRCCHAEDTVFYPMFKEIKLICKFMDDFTQTVPLKQALRNKADRDRVFTRRD
jgi:hypothetical protein